MTSLWKSRFLCLAAVVGLALCATASALDLVNTLPNGGFESGMPEPWYVTHTGDYRVVHDSKEAHSGQYFATFAWRAHPAQCYSALCNPHPDVHPRIPVYHGVSYQIGVWARGTGALNLWVNMGSKSGKFMGTDFGSAEKLTDDWKLYRRTWTPPEGVTSAALFIKVSTGAVVSFDDASFSYDRDSFTPPEAEGLDVVPQVNARDAEVKLYLNGKALDETARILYGEQVVAIEAKATGATPKLSGSVRFGDHGVKLDGRWRAAPLPEGDAWRKAGFDDREWKPVKADAGIWAADGAEAIALRRVVLWKSSRKDPWRENQWVVIMRDRAWVAPGSVGAFVTRVKQPSKTPAKELTLHIEAPAFLTLLDRDEQASFAYTNYRHKEMATRPVRRDDAEYIHYEVTYNIPKEPVPGPGAAYAPLYFQADEKIPRAAKGYTFSFWREANGNITDVPTVLPITVTGPVNGRQCKYFHLTYYGLPLRHSGSFQTYSIAERYAFADTLVHVGMNVAWATAVTEERGANDYWRYLKKKGVQLEYGSNLGMNWPGSGSGRLKENPELQAKFYDGSKEAFENGLGHHHTDMTGKTMWCQEYLASDGKVFYDTLRPRFEEAKKALGDILYTMWDWEYPTVRWSCFCPRCKTAFGKFANIPNAAQMSDEHIVTKHPQKWIKFRLDQSARHQLSMMKFLDEYDILLTNWHPGSALKNPDFDYSLLRDAYNYHFMGWPGSDVPLLGAGRGPEFNSAWKELSPDIHLVGHTIVNLFPSHVIDERMFKIWTLNVALGTHGGGWLIWQEVAFNQTHGQSYFMGEATRLINEFEEFFKKRKHISGKFRQEGLVGRANELIALESPDGKEALVLLFNQSDRPAQVTVTVKDAAAGWPKVQQWEGRTFPGAGKATVTVPEKDVIALHYE